MSSESGRPYFFIFTWSIHNFSHLAVEENAVVISPKFVVEFIQSTEFHLALFPRDPDNPGFIYFYLCQKEDSPTFQYQICFRNSDGEFENEVEVETYSPPNNGVRKLVLNDLCNYLKNDTFDVRCFIYNGDGISSIKAIMCYASTKIKVLNLDYTWTLDDIIESNLSFKPKINKTAEISTYSSGIPALKLHLLNGLNFEDDAIHFVIESPVNSRTFFLVFVIHLMDANGSVAHTVKGRVLFKKSSTKQRLDLPFVSKTKLLSNDKLYLPNGKLNIQCEFAISTNDVEYEISSIKFGKGIQVKPSQTGIDLLPVGLEGKRTKAFHRGAM